MRAYALLCLTGLAAARHPPHKPHRLDAAKAGRDAVAAVRTATRAAARASASASAASKSSGASRGSSKHSITQFAKPECDVAAVAWFAEAQTKCSGFGDTSDSDGEAMMLELCKPGNECIDHFKSMPESVAACSDELKDALGGLKQLDCLCFVMNEVYFPLTTACDFIDDDGTSSKASIKQGDDCPTGDVVCAAGEDGCTKEEVCVPCGQDLVSMIKSFGCDATWKSIGCEGDHPLGATFNSVTTGQGCTMEPDCPNAQLCPDSAPVEIDEAYAMYQMICTSDCPKAVKDGLAKIDGAPDVVNKFSCPAEIFDGLREFRQIPQLCDNGQLGASGVCGSTACCEALDGAAATAAQSDNCKQYFADTTDPLHRIYQDANGFCTGGCFAELKPALANLDANACSGDRPFHHMMNLLTGICSAEGVDDACGAGDTCCAATATFFTSLETCASSNSITLDDIPTPDDVLNGIEEALASSDNAQKFAAQAKEYCDHPAHGCYIDAVKALLRSGGCLDRQERAELEQLLLADNLVCDSACLSSFYEIVTTDVGDLTLETIADESSSVYAVTCSDCGRKVLYRLKQLGKFDEDLREVVPLLEAEGEALCGGSFTDKTKRCLATLAATTDAEEKKMQLGKWVDSWVTGMLDALFSREDEVPVGDICGDHCHLRLLRDIGRIYRLQGAAEEARELDTVAGHVCKKGDQEGNPYCISLYKTLVKDLDEGCDLDKIVDAGNCDGCPAESMKTFVEGMGCCFKEMESMFVSASPPEYRKAFCPEAKTLAECKPLTEIYNGVCEATTHGTVAAERCPFAKGTKKGKAKVDLGNIPKEELSANKAQLCDDLKEDLEFELNVIADRDSCEVVASDGTAAGKARNLQGDACPAGSACMDIQGETDEDTDSAVMLVDDGLIEYNNLESNDELLLDPSKKDDAVSGDQGIQADIQAGSSAAAAANPPPSSAASAASVSALSLALAAAFMLFGQM